MKCGSKPMAFFELQDRYVDLVKEEILNEYNLNVYYIQDIENYDGWKIVYIYKYDYLLDIIKNLPDTPQTPMTIG